MHMPKHLSNTLDFVAYHASVCPSRTASVDLQTGEEHTYAELDALVACCAGHLSGMLQTGDRVAVLARNCIETLVMHFACARAGLVFQPLNWRLTGSELRAQVRDATPSLLVYQDEFVLSARQAAEGAGLDLVGIMAFMDAVRSARPSEARPRDPDAPITLLYTSGTTGHPKGVIVTERNAWTTALNFAFANDVSARDVLLCDMPMFHVAGLFGVARGALFMGSTVLISDRFSPSTTLARLSDRDLGITHVFAVPQMAAAMVQDPAYASADLTRLKAMVIGGAPLPKVLVERLLADGVMPVEGYGSSEAGTVFGMPVDRDTIARKAGSCGVPAMMIAARVVDGYGHDVADGETGEIWLKGPSVTPGYWNQPEVTARAFKDGWFKTGDAAVRDADGFYRIVDRWKDMYISGGENVYPAEVEAVLAELDDIAEAAVIGIADTRWGETGCAYVVLRPGRSLNTDTVMAHCRARLAGYKVPKRVRFIQALPRAASGKVKKEELRRDLARQGESQ
jgi:fatty-acyl-CoA synthase